MFKKILKFKLLAVLTIIVSMVSVLNVYSASWQPTKRLTNNIIEDTCATLGVGSFGSSHIIYAESDGATSSLVYLTNASGTWVKTYLKTGSQFFCPVDLKVSKSNKIHFTYQSAYDVSTDKGIVPDTSEVYYGTNTSGAWKLWRLSNNSVADFAPQLAVDSSGKAHIFYTRKVLVSGRIVPQVRYVTNASGSWVYKNISTTTYGSYAGDLAIDSLGKLHASVVIHSSPIKRDVWYITNQTGSFVKSRVSNTEIFCNGNCAVGEVGFTHYTPKIALDSTGKVHILYTVESLLRGDEHPDYSLFTTDNKLAGWVKNKINFGFQFPLSAHDFSVDKNDKTHIVLDIGYTTASEIKYVTNPSGAWVVQKITTSLKDWRPRLGLDQNNKVQVAWLRKDTSGDFEVFFRKQQ